MKIILMILLSTCLSLTTADYPRFKRKGMVQTGPPRPPAPPPQFAKKWGKPPSKIPPQFVHGRPPFQGQPPSRINMRGQKPQPQIHGYNMQHIGQLQLQQAFQTQKFSQFPSQQQKQIHPPIIKKEVNKNFFSHPNVPISGQILQFPSIEKKVLPPKSIHKPEKHSFISSMSLPSEYDSHIQSNSIPLSTNTIKQVGEKGPIHTIPAPNLTPADKPSNLDQRKYFQRPQQEVKYAQPEFSQEESHYQVTEQQDLPTSVIKYSFRDQNNGGDKEENAQAYQNIFYGHNMGVTVQDNGNHGVNIGLSDSQGTPSNQEEMVFSNSQNFQVVNGQFSTGQPSNLHTQAIQTSYEQQKPQAMSQFVQSDNYGQKYPQEAEDKSSDVKPELHSFNYDEQAHQAKMKSGMVTATYSLGSDDVVKGHNPISRSSSIDPLTQAQIVQSYFDTRSSNDVEPDAKPSASGSDQDLSTSSFFNSLPNKDAAERLAKLQAAGKVNSSLMQMAAKKSSKGSTKEQAEDMPTIYVPDVDGNNGNDKNQDQSEYEDYSQEEESSKSDEISGFGQKTGF